MKKVKYILTLIIFAFALLCTAQIPEQTTNGGSITSPRGNFSFSFPSGTYTQYDTVDVLMYSKGIDSLLNMQVHYIEGVTNNVSQTDPIWQNAISQNYGDTLRAMGSMMVALSNGTLESIQNLPAVGNRPRGIEIGIKYASETADFDLFVSRIYYYNNKFLTFSISSIISDAVRLGTYKTAFFNSITFY